MMARVKSFFLILLLINIQGAHAEDSVDANLSLLDQLQSENLISAPESSVFAEKNKTSTPLIQPPKDIVVPKTPVEKAVAPPSQSRPKPSPAPVKKLLKHLSLCVFPLPQQMSAR